MMTQGHTATKLWSQDLNVGSLAPEKTKQGKVLYTAGSYSLIGADISNNVTDSNLSFHSDR